MKKAVKLVTTCLILALFVVACNRGRGVVEVDSSFPDRTVAVDMNNLTEVSFFDHFSSVEIIPLERGEASSFAKPAKLVKFNDTYYVLGADRYELHLFDASGRFIGKISNRGSGKGTYNRIADFNINRYTGNIELLEPRGVVMVYSPGLEFIDEFWFDVQMAERFMNINSDTLVLYSMREPEQLLFYSRSQGRVISKESGFAISGNPYLYPMDRQRDMPFTESDGKVLFQPTYSNFVYDLSRCTTDVYHLWDFGKYNLDIERVKSRRSNIGKVIAYMRQVDRVSSFLYFLEVDDRIFTIPIRGDRGINLVYDRTTGDYELFAFYSEGIAHPWINFIEGNTLYWLDRIDADMAERLKGLLDPEQQQILAGIDTDDNAVILMYHLKDR